MCNYYKIMEILCEAKKAANYQKEKLEEAEAIVEKLRKTEKTSSYDPDEFYLDHH